MSQWFISRQGQSTGPFSTEQLRAMAAQGQLTPDDQVWNEQAKKWAPARTLSGLFAAPAAPIAQGILEPPKPTGRAGLRERPETGQTRGAHATPLAGRQITSKPPAPPAAVTSAKPQAAGGEPAFFQKLRALPKPILFGLFGAVGGLIGALLFGELLWFLLQPPQHKAEEAPPLQMAVVPALKVYAGGTNKFKVKIARNKDKFNGPVDLEAKTPEGVTVLPIKLSPDQTEAEVIVEADKSLKPGKLQVAFKAVGPKEDGAPDASGNLELEVALSPPFLGISVTPKVEVYQGGKAQFMVKVGRNGFTGPVSLSFENVPPGIKLPNLEILSGRDELAIVLETDRSVEIDPDKKMKVHDIKVNCLAKPDSGAELANNTKFNLEVKEAPIPKADVLFVLDLTGSMQFAINGIKKGLKNFADQLKGQKIDARIALLGFRDIEADLFAKNAFVLFLDGRVITMNHLEFDELLKTFQEKGIDIFTKDFDKFGELVGTLKASGGGDEPESSPLALVHASKAKFRTDASKVVVLITDATPKLFHFGKQTESIDDAVKALQKANIDQFHLVAKQAHLKNPQTEKAYQPILDAFQKSSFFDIDKTLNDDAFAGLLPELSKAISNFTIAKLPVPTGGDLPPAPPPASAAELPPPPAPPDLSVKAVQSTQGYAKEDSLRLIVAIGVWTAVVAVAICLFLIAGQLFYSRKAWMNSPDFLKGCAGGLTAGLLGGLIVQTLFQLTPGGTTWDIISRTFGWGLLGALIGGGMALIVPNLKWYRGLEGGLAGGIFGALGFMLVSLLMGELGGRLLGAAILGFFIGVMIALAEMVFRRYWLELTFSAREIRTITLGTATVGIGGDEKLASVFVQGAAALALRYRLEGERVLCQDVATGKEYEVPPGDRRQVGNVTITVCSPASAKTIGLALQLSSGRKLALGEGMPLTAEDLPGLQPQGTDGIVALISRRPNDPKTMLLRNRSKQHWAIQDAAGKQSSVEPGRAIELGLNLLINFGPVQAKLIAEEPAKR